MDSAFLITAFVTLFVVIDPLGLAPLFVAPRYFERPYERGTNQGEVERTGHFLPFAVP